MSSEGIPPSPFQPPKEPNISARTLFMVLAVVFVVIIAAALALVLVMGGGGGSSKSPSGALQGYAAGINDGDFKAAFDHTILKFMPNYDEMLSQFDNMSSYMNGVSITFSDVSVVYNSSMTNDQRQEANDTIEEISTMMNLNIQDFAFVEYTMKISYSGYSPMSFPGEMLCVEVNGSWYVAMLSFPDMSF